MELPDWRTLHLNEGVLREPAWDDAHIVLWLPGKRDRREQHWERVSSVPRAQIQIERGIGAVNATSIQATQPIRSFLGRLIPRFRKSGLRPIFE